MGFCDKFRFARGETEGSFAMSELSGIVSLFLIAAAFLTSCTGQQPSQDAPPPHVVLQIAQ
ncbi:hypothetical protein ASD64_09860 [Mesorhizobium sp. Root157]|nr:hypothetical protein ASD64_09860 [Mesorhizobium sp. Root157]